MTPEQRIQKQLEKIYGAELASNTWKKIDQIIQEYQNNISLKKRQQLSAKIKLDETDAILITYGDQLRNGNGTPLQCLNNFLSEHLEKDISGVHILPFYPYSSDDGFSVIDYREVDPEIGSWEDIHLLSKRYRLMFDAVVNHISRESLWFKSYLNLEAPYNNYFLNVDPEEDLSMVFRPRALPLLTRVKTMNGYHHVWTTFSDDQIDLNFRNPEVLLEIIDLLLFYASKGAELIRLDAIAYLWKEIGTSSIHLPQTHAVVKIWRSILDLVAPWVILITETNVPHKDNISYFGEIDTETGNTDEAQMVYQFSLAPLILFTFKNSNVNKLSKWADELEAPGIFFNFIASHDGIGVMPAKGILSEDEIQEIVDQTIEHGGQVSYKSNSDGTKSVYELNITLYDWLNNPFSNNEKQKIDRFLASQAIMLALSGVPGIYFHSLIGSNNCHSCVEETGRARSINRQKLDYYELITHLNDPNTKSSIVLEGYRELLKKRSSNKAFHPRAKQKVLFLDRKVFSLIRKDLQGNETVLCLTNVSNEPRELKIGVKNLIPRTAGKGLELFSGKLYKIKDGMISIRLLPYQTNWIRF